ncbi:hypothetical protein MJO28_005174 [Puccinia striiformis f. sp. tritici]|uniref:Uncharacterized protein n=3 Tax=Puccinia striiformis TaxID=27350 RepID=A0A2S4WED1_9BASI|nr:hypothetical protein Pst134EB_033399 [Puccinia striiformis f. sp. tritici]KAI7954774.1 hypothetical protein MJO28_005174 [Puccinia striiformis f. sp. tritici]POW15661.1 hypothetical protein PSTT_01945 [Puccinia striiformis]POW20146.1 hypothetical protein PSHT_03849 [Puccinia striiformis]
MVVVAQVTKHDQPDLLQKKPIKHSSTLSFRNPTNYSLGMAYPVPLKTKSKQRSATLISLAGSSNSSSANTTAATFESENEHNEFKTSTPPRRSLQLLNPSASPYVSLTPGLLSPDRHQHQHSRLFSPTNPIPVPHRHPPSPSPLGLSTSQHTLKTLAGGRYYDEYDEDEDQSQNYHQPLSSSCQASFPPSSSLNSTPSSSLGRSQSQTVKNHIIDFNNNNPPKHTKRLSSTPTATTNDRARHPQSSANHTPDRPPRKFNLFSLHDWNQFLEQKPLLGFCIRVLLLVLFCGLLVIALVWALLPPVDEKDLPILRIPTSFEALKKLNALLQIYKTANYYRVLGSFILIYLFLQMFSLPGSMYLSILAGAMFGVQVALPLVCMCVGTGAMLCYLMSMNLASSLVIHSPSLRTRLEDWKVKLSTKTNKLDLFAYLVVIRISPLPPHWVVNLLAPHVGIRLGVFWLTTCLGILPVSLIHTQLGTTLDQMVGPEDLSFLTAKNLTGLALVALGVLVPVLIRWHLRKKNSDEINTSITSSTIESRPFSARIGLSLDDDELDHTHEQSLTTTSPGRQRKPIRSLSGQTYENSSITNLHQLGRVDSSDTLSHSQLLSPPSNNQHTTLSSRSTSPRQSNPTSMTPHNHHHSCPKPTRNKVELRNNIDPSVHQVDLDSDQNSISIDELKSKIIKPILSPHSNHPPSTNHSPSPTNLHHLSRNQIILHNRTDNPART